MLTKIFRKIHRILGLLLSILFLMWFISGIVMIYHSFPRVNQKLKLARQESLTGPLPAVDSLLQVLPDSSRLGGLSVDMYPAGISSERAAITCRFVCRFIAGCR